MDSYTINKNYVDRYTPTVTSELGYCYCNINGAQGQGALWTMLGCHGGYNWKLQKGNKQYS